MRRRSVGLPTRSGVTSDPSKRGDQTLRVHNCILSSVVSFAVGYHFACYGVICVLPHIYKCKFDGGACFWRILWVSVQQATRHHDCYSRLMLSAAGKTQRTRSVCTHRAHPPPPPLYTRLPIQLASFNGVAEHVNNVTIDVGPAWGGVCVCVFRKMKRCTKEMCKITEHRGG